MSSGKKYAYFLRRNGTRRRLIGFGSATGAPVNELIRQTIAST